MAKKNGKTHAVHAHTNVADMLERSCIEAAHDKRATLAQRKAFAHLGGAVAAGLRQNTTWHDSFKRLIDAAADLKRKGN